MGVGAIIVAIAIPAIYWAFKRFAPGVLDHRPKLVEVRPLEAVSRSSIIVTPAGIALTAIQDALEKAAPPALSRKLNIPPLPGFSNAEINWSIQRRAFAIARRP